MLILDATGLSTSQCQFSIRTIPHLNLNLNVHLHLICTHQIALSHNFFISTSLLHYLDQHHAFLSITHISRSPLIRFSPSSATNLPLQACRKEGPSLSLPKFAHFNANHRPYVPLPRPPLVRVSRLHLFVEFEGSRAGRTVHVRAQS